MKNLIAIAVLAITIASCSGGVGKYADAINGLSGDWNATTETVTALVSNVTEATANWNKMKGEMALPEGVTVAEEDAAKLNALRTNYAQVGEGFGGLNNDLATFVNEWTEKAKGLTELTEGLAAGKIEGDVQAKIDGLKGTIEDAKTKAGSWQETLGQLTQQATNIFQQYQSAVSSMTAQEG